MIEIQTKFCLSKGESGSELGVGFLVEMKLARAVFFVLVRLKRDGQSPACRNRDVQRPGFCVIVISLTWFGENTVGRFRVFV